VAGAVVGHVHSVRGDRTENAELVAFRVPEHLPAVAVVDVVGGHGAEVERTGGRKVVMRRLVLVALTTVQLAVTSSG
jgi:hypothetical protein